MLGRFHFILQLRIRKLSYETGGSEGGRGREGGREKKDACMPERFAYRDLNLKKKPGQVRD